MTRTQIQLPDSLYGRTRQYADYREMSLAEVFRMVVEMFLNIHATGLNAGEKRGSWAVPLCRATGMVDDPFRHDNWRERLYADDEGGEP